MVTTVEEILTQGIFGNVIAVFTAGVFGVDDGEIEIDTGFMINKRKFRRRKKQDDLEDRTELNAQHVYLLSVLLGDEEC